MPGSRKRRHGRTTRPTATVPVTPAISQPGAASGREVSHLWTAFGQEVGRFPQAQAQACLHAASRISQCHSLPEVLDLQGKLFQEAMRAYLDETGRLAEVWTQACFRTWTSLQPH